MIEERTISDLCFHIMEGCPVLPILIGGENVGEICLARSTIWEEVVAGDDVVHDYTH